MSLPELPDTTKTIQGKVWLRITAFLSLKAPNTRTTYSGIITEWCQFLGAEPGSQEAEIKIISATDLHSIAYRRWLESQPGEKPRSLRNQSENQSKSRAVAKYSGISKVKRDGLESTLSNATIHKKFAALRRMYRMLIASNLGIAENPFEIDRVPPPPKDAGRKRPTEMVDFDLVMEVIQSPDLSHPKGVRDRAILALLFGAGIRRSELSVLRVSDIRKTNSGTTYLYLRHTKAKKDAEQVVPDWAAQFLDEHIGVRRNDGANDHSFVFTGYTGKAGKSPTDKPISDSGIYKLFRSYCMIAGAGNFLTPHSARATAITKLLVDGVSHREVQEFSRHSSIQMVEWYDKRRFDVERNPGKNLSFGKLTDKKGEAE